MLKKKAQTEEDGEEEVVTWEKVSSHAKGSSTHQTSHTTHRAIHTPHAARRTPHTTHHVKVMRAMRDPMVADDEAKATLEAWYTSGEFGSHAT